MTVNATSCGLDPYSRINRNIYLFKFLLTNKLFDLFIYLNFYYHSFVLMSRQSSRWRLASEKIYFVNESNIIHLFQVCIYKLSTVKIYLKQTLIMIGKFQYVSVINYQVSIWLKAAWRTKQGCLFDSLSFPLLFFLYFYI